MPYYLHVQDFIDAYIGPFDTPEDAQRHFEWCRDVRGDGATLMGIVTEVPPGEFFLTKEQDERL